MSKTIISFNGLRCDSDIKPVVALFPGFNEDILVKKYPNDFVNCEFNIDEYNKDSYYYTMDYVDHVIDVAKNSDSKIVFVTGMIRGVLKLLAEKNIQVAFVLPKNVHDRGYLYSCNMQLAKYYKCSINEHFLNQLKESIVDSGFYHPIFIYETEDSLENLFVDKNDDGSYTVSLLKDLNSLYK